VGERGIAFLGASALGAACCEAIVELGAPVAKILSIPREFRISWSTEPVTNAQFSDLGELARRNGIPFAYVGGGRAEDYLDALGPTHPDLLVVAGWYYLIPGSIRARAPLGAVGVHASLLPRYRGGAPLVWAIIRGETEAGVTLFHLSSGVDDGDVVARSSFPIAESDDIGAVVARATRHSVDLLRANIASILDGTAPRARQDERLATVVPQRTPADGRIRWESLDAKRAYDWVRAQTRPYPGAFTFLDSARITIWRARIGHAVSPPRPPGTIEVRERLSVWCADGTVLDIVEASLDEGAAQTDTELIAAARIADGTRFAAPEGDR
jgi:methionyl-tRNA formyltransferase